MKHFDDIVIIFVQTHTLYVHAYSKFVCSIQKIQMFNTHTYLTILTFNQKRLLRKYLEKNTLHEQLPLRTGWKSVTKSLLTRVRTNKRCNCLLLQAHNDLPRAYVHILVQFGHVGGLYGSCALVQYSCVTL